MKKFFAGLFAIFFCNLVAGVDPFSKITVTSQRAVFQKESADKKSVRLRYKDAVQVTFADATTVSSDVLDVFVESGKQAKRVVFTGNVSMNRQNQSVFADEAEIVVPEKRCELRGHVKIEQVKKKEKDIPMKTKCELAQLSWESDEVLLVGGDKKPVSTVIELGGKFRKLQKK